MQDALIQDAARERSTHESGFTLMEALLALAIVALVVTTCLMIRTNSLIDASEARNWRVAREAAQEILSKLSAGAQEEPPDYQMGRQPIPSMKEVKGWTYQIVIGEERISSVEADLESDMETDDSERPMADRRAWQRERDDLRKSRRAGVSYYDYQEKSQQEEEERLAREDEPPSEDQFEEVAVFVFFPNVRLAAGKGGAEFSHFVLKARLSTMAIEGMTPEEAETVAQSQGKSTDPASGGTGDGGQSK